MEKTKAQKKFAKRLPQRIQESERAESESIRKYDALKKSEERFKALAEASFEAIFLSDQV
jgi:hypothetical protein